MRGTRSTWAASRGCGRQPSPALSDSSELSILSQSPSPPPGYRQPSPALSDSSQLSVLSRSPSPPPELLEKITLLSKNSLKPDFIKRALNGRFLPKMAKYKTSPVPLARSSKRLRELLEGPPKVVTPQGKSTDLRTPKNAVTGNTCVRSPEAGGSRNLDLLPKEIRQLVYAYCLDVDEPVLIKECCGPTSSRRARANCPKHGERCRKIGKRNGPTLYNNGVGARKVYGRFSILSVSRSVNEEASWVLYTQGNLVIKSLPALQAYLSEKQCTFFRLPNLPVGKYVESMWLSAARFRSISFALLWENMSWGDPVEDLYRLYEAIAFLMKSWSLQKEKPASPRAVTVLLQALYTAIIPFNSGASIQMASEWSAFHHPYLGPGLISDFDLIGEETQEIVERLLDLIGRHGGLSQWKIIVKAPRRYNEDLTESEIPADEDKGIAGLRRLEECCFLNGVELELTTHT